MVSADTIRNIIGIIGNVISFGLFLSPVPTFIQIIKRRAVEQFSPVPYLATFMNCMLWVFYGLPFVHPNSLLVVTINGIGCALEASYLIIFFIFSDKKIRLKMMNILLVEFAFIAVIAACVLKFAHTHDERSMIVGSLCVVFGTGMYAAPLSIMKLVIQMKSIKYMPFYLSFTGFLNGLCWTAYALIKFDIFMLIPNGLGLLLSTAQLMLYAIYYRTTPKDGSRNIQMDLCDHTRE